jgi:EAL domain-containing protein (putative c-di-GMP-specific phosphodiesterase class I)
LSKQISPGIFVPKSEELNLSTKIDRYVIEEAFKFLSENQIHLSKL